MVLSENDPRRTVDNLRVLHQDLEPQLRDVYVEGRTDQRRFSWYIREAGLQVSSVYAVDDRVLIDAEAVRAAGGEIGPRGRLLGLAQAVGEWGLAHPAVTCIVDQDRDCLAASVAPRPGHLMTTDFGSFEGYLFTPRPLGQFLELCLESSEPADRMIELLTPALNELFIVRAALHTYGPNVALIPRFTSCCARRRGELTVDSVELVRRSLAAAGESRRQDAVIQGVELLRTQLPTDRRRAIRGHDVTPMLAFVLNLRNDLSKPLVLERMWQGCLRTEDLDEHPMFRDLRARFT